MKLHWTRQRRLSWRHETESSHGSWPSLFELWDVTGATSDLLPLLSCMQNAQRPDLHFKNQPNCNIFISFINSSLSDSLWRVVPDYWFCLWMVPLEVLLTNPIFRHQLDTNEVQLNHLPLLIGWGARIRTWSDDLVYISHKKCDANDLAAWKMSVGQTETSFAIIWLIASVFGSHHGNWLLVSISKYECGFYFYYKRPVTISFGCEG